jgi:hypothetical protein
VRPGDLPAVPVGFGVVHGEQPVAYAAGNSRQPAEQDPGGDGYGAYDARPARARRVQVSDCAAAWAAPAGAPDSDARVGSETSPSSHGGLFSLVVLLILIMSLAIRARSRAWVVFRWVGVAAPAQQYVRGIAHRTVARFPDRCGRCRGCGATARTLRHSGSGCGLCGLTGMAVPSPPSRSQVPRRANAVAPVRAFPMARGLVPVTPRATLDPVVGESLEDDYCDLIS